jgi:glycine cleavage system H protein
MSTTEIKYTKEHEWVRIDNDIAYIGITEFAQGELGDIVFVDLPSVGKQVQQANTLCVVESTKAASDVYAPISGTVVEVNSELS